MDVSAPSLAVSTTEDAEFDPPKPRNWVASLSAVAWSVGQDRAQLLLRRSKNWAGNWVSFLRCSAFRRIAHNAGRSPGLSSGQSRDGGAGHCNHPLQCRCDGYWRQRGLRGYRRSAPSNEMQQAKRASVHPAALSKLVSEVG